MQYIQQALALSVIKQTILQQACFIKNTKTCFIEINILTLTNFSLLGTGCIASFNFAGAGGTNEGGGGGGQASAIATATAATAAASVSAA